MGEVENKNNKKRKMRKSMKTSSLTRSIKFINL